MAKKNPKHNKKDVIGSLHKADEKHEKETSKYLKVIEKMYKDAIDELSVLAMKIDGIPLDQHFTFDAHKGISKDADEVIRKLASRITAVTTIGSRNEWLAACEKSDQFIESIAKTSNLTKKTLQGYHDRNLEGLAAFQQRKVDGMDLSDRVWKHVAPLKDEVELVTDTTTKYYKHGINSSKSMTKFDRAIGTGTSAQQLSQDIRSCLKEPNKLFRRVRDKNGNLQLSKAAKLYHPGQGVYRSSYKNAMRVARSEINMAYRQSDYDRWQKLDWVIGIKIQLSNNHTIKNKKGVRVPFHDICDELVGDYPKNFKFVGWHPQCRCFVTPIMINYEDLDDDREVIDDDNYKQLPHKDAVTDVPQNFKDYVVNNQERISGWSSVPYYIKDNPQWFDRAIHPEKYIIKALELDDVTKKLLDDFRQYGFNHSGSKLFNKALDEALKAQLAGLQKEFEEAMAKMKAIRKKNEASKISKAKNKHKPQETTRTKGDILAAAKQRQSQRTQQQKDAIQQAWNKRNQLKPINERLVQAKVDYLEVNRHKEKKSDNDIITMVGGGDKTSGSCSSLALCFAGNKGGYSVLDFRGGNSCDFFSRTANIKDIATNVGGMVVANYSDFQNAKDLLATVKDGKYYYFTCGAHAAIVRKTATGFEYLELQTNNMNGFKPLTDAELRYRFGAKRSHSRYGYKFKGTDVIIDIDLLNKDAGFKKMLGYINTESGKQKKGAGGTMK